MNKMPSGRYSADDVIREMEVISCAYHDKAREVDCKPRFVDGHSNLLKFYAKHKVVDKAIKQYDARRLSFPRCMLGFSEKADYRRAWTHTTTAPRRISGIMIRAVLCLGRSKR